MPHGRDVDYFIGYPFFNDTLGNITGIVPEQTEWTVIDRNISEFMQDTWMNFTKYGFVSSLFLFLSLHYSYRTDLVAEFGHSL